MYPLRRAEFRKIPTIGYMYLHYEAVLVNLLEGLLFNEDAPEALGDFELELLDYCYRKVLYLNAIPDEERLIEEIDKEKVCPGDVWARFQRRSCGVAGQSLRDGYNCSP